MDQVAADRAVIEASEAEDRIEKAAEALSHDPMELDRIGVAHADIPQNP